MSDTILMSSKDENENENDETLMSSNENNENEDDDETIKYLNDLLDEIIDKSKSFEEQIKSLKNEKI